jgi:antitoxin (DNA-binding transcriptional repressor) of toxin-antitoxin stability system
MADYSLSDASRTLDALIHRASKGETVAIVTGDGTVARLVIDAASEDRPKSIHDLDWMQRVRVRPRYPSNTMEIIRDMRSDYRY